MSAAAKMTAKQFTGYDRLHNSHLNKGTAFTETERRAFGLEGLLPPAMLSLELQVARRHDEIVRLENDLLKYLVLSDLQARNETLYYAVLMSDPATYMPIVYTPTVGEACQKFGHIFRQPRGIYLPISARGRVKELLSNWPKRTCASSWSPTASASSGWGISAPAAWASRSENSRCALHVPACRRSTACRSHSTSAPTTRLCSSTRCTSDCGKAVFAAANTWRSLMNSLRRYSNSIRNAVSSGKTLRTSMPYRSSSVTATRSALSMMTSRAPRGWPSRVSWPRCASQSRKSPTSGFCFLAPARREPELQS
jgi:hypothetical protein